jgi:hypothetical protein
MFAPSVFAPLAAPLGASGRLAVLAFPAPLRRLARSLATDANEGPKVLDDITIFEP